MSTAFAEDNEQTSSQSEQNDLDFFLADEDEEKIEGEDTKKKKKKKNKKKHSHEPHEDESVTKTAAELDQADIAEDTREDEELRGILRYKYLIVGGGTASYAAIKAIREADPDAEVMTCISQCNSVLILP